MNAYTKNSLKIIKSLPVPTDLSASSPSKISLKCKTSFSMLAGPKFGCPGATKACIDCYAMSGRHHFPAVQTALAKNWLLVNKLENTNKFDRLIEKLLNIIPKDIKIFRIHESSDFHSQWYLNAWAVVVKARRDINFWAYTRSFHLNFTNLTRNPNFALWASTDEYNLVEAKRFVRRFRKSGVKHAYGPWDPKIEIPPNSFICPVTTHTMDIKGACEKCKLCIIKKKTHKNVVFLKH